VVSESHKVDIEIESLLQAQTVACVKYTKHKACVLALFLGVRRRNLQELFAPASFEGALLSLVLL